MQTLVILSILLVRELEKQWFIADYTFWEMVCTFAPDRFSLLWRVPNVGVAAFVVVWTPATILNQDGRLKYHYGVTLPDFFGTILNSSKITCIFFKADMFNLVALSGYHVSSDNPIQKTVETSQIITKIQRLDWFPWFQWLMTLLEKGNPGLPLPPQSLRHKVTYSLPFHKVQP